MRSMRLFDLWFWGLYSCGFGHILSRNRGSNRLNQPWISRMGVHFSQPLVVDQLCSCHHFSLSNKMGRIFKSYVKLAEAKQFTLVKRRSAHDGPGGMGVLTLQGVSHPVWFCQEVWNHGRSMPQWCWLDRCSFLFLERIRRNLGF